MVTDKLLAYLFDNQPHLLTQSMERWVSSSRRFTEFASTFRNKIRKKIRTAKEEQNLLDLRLELETAYLLLQQKRLNVEYEPLQAGGGRSPDFAVTYTTSMTFMVEVTRLQAEQNRPPVVMQNPDAQRVDDRLIDAISGKLGQMQPQGSNVLIVGSEAEPMRDDDLHATLVTLQQRAEGDDGRFLQRHGFRNRAHFFRYYQRLSEVILRNLVSSSADSTITWINGQAKHPLPGKVRSKVRAALYRSHGA